MCIFYGEVHWYIATLRQVHVNPHLALDLLDCRLQIYVLSITRQAEQGYKQWYVQRSNNEHQIHIDISDFTFHPQNNSTLEINNPQQIDPRLP